MEALACEAAAALRLRRQLGERCPTRDRELIDALDEPEGVSSIMLREEADDRLKALEEMACHRRATSAKGALFQTYLAAHHSLDPRAMIGTRLTASEDRELADSNRRISRLHYNVVGYLELLVMDDDLDELRRWYWTPAYDTQPVCDRAMNDRKGLIAACKLQAAREAAARN